MLKLMIFNDKGQFYKCSTHNSIMNKKLLTILIAGIFLFSLVSAQGLIKEQTNIYTGTLPLNITNVQQDDVLQYDSVLGKWINKVFTLTSSIINSLIITNDLEVGGDLTVNGSINADGVYGSVWGNEIGTTNILSQNTYYNITNLTEGELSGITFDGDSKLTILHDGVYHITAQNSFSDGANTEFHIALGINGVRQIDCHAQRKLGTGGDVGSTSFTCLERLSAGDIITSMIENVDNTADVTIHSIQLNIVQAGR